MRSHKKKVSMEMQKHGQDEQDEQDSGREEQELTVKNIGCAMKVHGALWLVKCSWAIATATGIEIGLLLNSGTRGLEIKRKNRIDRAKQLPRDFIL